jgi:hypothetical protein
MGKVQVGAAIAASFRYIGEAWSKAWGVMLILVWFTAMLQAIELLKPGWTLVSFLGFILSLFLTTAATGALYRIRLEGDHPGDRGYAAGGAGIQWGGLEWRVLGANLLVGVIIGVIVFVVFFVWAIALGVAVQGNTAELQALQGGSDTDKMAALAHIMLGPGGLVTAIILLPAIAGLVYLGARFLLFTPLAADARAFDLGKAWALAGGAMPALLCGVILIFLVEFVIGGVAGGLAGLFATLSGHPGAGGVWGGAVGQVLGAAINVPLFAGLALFVYRAQRGDTAVAATFS